jgi:hypothetical protein
VYIKLKYVGSLRPVLTSSDRRHYLGSLLMIAEINFTNSFSGTDVQVCATAIHQLFYGCYTILTGKLVDKV